MLYVDGPSPRRAMCTRWPSTVHLMICRRTRARRAPLANRACYCRVAACGCCRSRQQPRPPRRRVPRLASKKGSMSPPPLLPPPALLLPPAFNKTINVPANIDLAPNQRNLSCSSDQAAPCPTCRVSDPRGSQHSQRRSGARGNCPRCSMNTFRACQRNGHSIAVWLEQFLGRLAVPFDDRAQARARERRHERHEGLARVTHRHLP